MTRALQLEGHVTSSPAARAMDAAFHWDADRDQQKQVALKTRWTSGRKNTADITLSLPSINQEMTVKSQVAVNQGKTLLDTTTALSFSPDARKALTLTSTLKDVTSSWESGSNYTLSLGLTHPHTDLDLKVDSHIAAANHRYSAAVDTWYLTSRRERKNMALRGEIDQLRRQISMEMVSPMKKVAMKGQVQSTEPLSLSLTNSVDDKSPVRAEITIDTAKRSVHAQANYDSARPDRAVIMKAYYVNDTAFEASVYRALENQVITDALMALRLNTSTLLHSRLHWRPAALTDIKMSAVRSLLETALNTKAAVQTVSAAVRTELTERYARSTESLAEDLRPTMELLDAEIQALGDASGSSSTASGASWPALTAPR